MEALRRKVLDILGARDHKQFFKDRRDLYQVLNFVFADDVDPVHVLLTLWFDIRDHTEPKNGRWKPAFLDDLLRHVRCELSLRGCVWRPATLKENQ